MTSSNNSFGGSLGMAALNSTYFMSSLRNRFDLPNPPPPEPKVAPMVSGPESGTMVDVVA